ncbi:hypothetical protein [Mucilaginibacter kameinonensis]|uniref:hypothetical protein n=1 Tax=Mucilaginibacter kameinonensis TaxID=452286 RepID=UPI000EF7A1F8|nr:hypothetical protein [Mucilaginibacter kameinonensis]
MSETNFSILNYSQHIKISVNEITAYQDHLHAYLQVPLHFILRVLNPKETAFDLLPGTFRLLFNQPKQLLSENYGLRGISVRQIEMNSGYLVTFKMDQREMQFIEQSRKGDLQMALEINVNAIIKNRVDAGDGRSFYSSDHIHAEIVVVNFIIPRSIWIEKLLPKTGFRNLKLIEIPLSHSNLKEAYKDIIAEFDKAEHYFNLHDYNKCVAHCRHTLDALTRNLRSIKNESKSETGFKWLQTVSTETFNWIDKINQSTSAIASKTHLQDSLSTLEETRQNLFI